MLAGNAQTRFDMVRGQGNDAELLRRQVNSNPGSDFGQPAGSFSQVLVVDFEEDSSKDAIKALSLTLTSWGLSSRRKS